MTALLATVATTIRDLGGHAPQQVWPPTWLVEDSGERA